MRRRPRTRKQRVRSLCTSRMVSMSVLHEHPFEPSGTTKRYGCVQTGRCRTQGEHEACARCGWPADEHPTTHQEERP